MKINIKYILTTGLLNLLIVLSALAQQDAVKGTVVDESGNPVRDVRVIVQSQPDEVVLTDSEGNFTIDAAKEQFLVVDIKNRARKIIAVSELQDNGNIVLEKATELINVGFNTYRSRIEIPSSIGTVRGNVLDEASVQTPGNALFGRINGLRVFQESGYFPDERQPTFDIRGRSTMRNNGILVLIDGVERPLNSVVVEEIESVSILKDAASKAKYGLRGGNGVMLINTKRGIVGKTVYNVSYEQGISQPYRLPEFLGAPDYARAVNQAMLNDGFAEEDLFYSPLDIENYQSGNYPTFWPNVNWVDEIFDRSGSFSTFNFNVQGGKKNADFFLNINYQNNEGFLKYTEGFENFSTQLDYDKLNFRGNLDLEITPTTEAQINLAGYLSSSQGPDNWGNLVNSVYSTPSAIYPVRNFNGSWGGTNIFDNNPAAQINDTGYENRIDNNWIVDLRLKQSLDMVLDGLSFEVFGAFDSQTDYFESNSKAFQYQDINPVFDSLGVLVDTVYNYYGEDNDLDPNREIGDLQATHYDLRGKLNYINTFGQHSIGAFAVWQQENQTFRGTNNEFRRRNIAANVHYGFADKYFVDATLSYYGTNRISDDDERFNFYPAIAGAWLVSREAFMQDVDFISALKLKASYGKVGNGRIPIDNLTAAQFGGTPSVVFGDQITVHGTYGQVQIPIGSKKYESSYESNFGLELELFNKLALNAEYFNVRREDIFVASIGQYSEIIGVLPEQVPSGIVENNGYEIDLTWSDQIGDFSYFITGRFSEYKNTIINSNEEFRPYEYLQREGRPMGQYFGWETNGFFADQADIDNSPVSDFGDVRPGDIKYVDQNGDGRINEFDEVPMGYASTPEIYYSANIGFGYKGFQVTALFQGTERSSAFLNDSHIYWPLRSVNSNISTWYDNYWTPDNQNAELPRLTTVPNNNNFRVNDIWLRDNSFLKLRYAEVAYIIPQTIYSGVGLEQIRVFLQGNNLFSIDEIEYQDPENIGISFPSLRTYTAGLNVRF